MNHTKRLLEIMAKLRNPNGGCPWDLEQNFKTIAPYTIEEAYEVADAIARGDMQNLKEELGDLLLQVVFHSQMASEDGLFTFEDVAQNIGEKMERRHPHVFGDATIKDADAQTENWENIKAEERKKKTGDSVLADVPTALPALMRAEKLQKRAARVGFDWPDTDGVRDKILEELNECEEATASGDKGHLQEEIGDLLFAVTNLARFHGIDPEEALRQTNAKFTKRFQFIEAALKKQNKKWEETNLDEMEALWQKAKTA
ncbi:MAG: nucleoside triphosphate pyrophosphohydrolase [Alphaproteobacteria bacterium]|nr:nucleoside triphosphate pyrophosphohydrolase [Alphaproteobacteria bacterium]